MNLRKLFSFASRPKRRKRRSPRRLVVAAEYLESRTLLSAVFGDFNGDAFADMVVGVPGENSESGGINVIYGTADGLSSNGDEFWRQGAAGIGDQAEAGDRFGEALAVGDFNGDGIDDLAIGVPGEDIGPIQDAGAVAILYGRAGEGLVANPVADVPGNQLIHQDTPSIPDAAERFDRFGSALTTGDFNDDGYADLSIGIPGENRDGLADVGAVQVIYGSAEGLSNRGRLLFQSEHAGDAGDAYDFFGSALAAGDVTGDGVDDLIVGIPGEDFETTVRNPDAWKDPSLPANITVLTVDAGRVDVFLGRAGLGISTESDLSFSQGGRLDVGNVADQAEDFDLFGTSVAVADLNNDGVDDIVIGAPGETVGTQSDAGAVNVLYFMGSYVDLLGRTNYSYDGGQFWTQNSLTSQSAERNELFGYSLAIGDFDGDGDSDLAVGSPGEDLGTLNDAGAVHVIKSAGTTGGQLNATGNRTFTQADSWNNDSAEKGDAFGSWLATGDTNHDGRADLAIAVPGEDVGLATNAGAVAVFRGTSTADIFSSNDQFWTQTSTDIAGIADTGDYFGGRLPVGLSTTGLAAPRFESLSGAPNTLFLDFDGHEDHYYGAPIKTPAFDYDFDESTFSITELAMIQDIWDTIAEDFAPFNVNVTTIAPGNVATTERVVFGGMSQDNILVGEVGPSGDSPVGAYTNPLVSNTAYVFSRSIFNRSSLFTGSTIGSIGSHEAGHGYGLTHKTDIDADGNELQEYSDGGTDWTPIMGMADQRSIWTVASMDHPTQNGVKIVGSNDVFTLQKTLGLRTDDHGSGVSTATNLGTLSTVGDSRIADGIIERIADHDTFVFSVSEQGSILLDLQVHDLNPNLDATLTLGDADTGAEIATVDDASRLGARLQKNVVPGRYFLKVKSVRQFVGDLGQYTLRIELGQLAIEGKPTPATKETYDGNHLLTTQTALSVTKTESTTTTSDAKVAYMMLPDNEPITETPERKTPMTQPSIQNRNQESETEKRNVEALDAVFADLDIVDLLSRLR